MSAHCDCYGTIFTDFARLEKNKPLVSPASSALVVNHGIGVQSRKLEVKREGWDRCAGCSDYRTGYGLSLAELLMNTLQVNGWYGS